MRINEEIDALEVMGIRSNACSAIGVQSTSFWIFSPISGPFGLGEGRGERHDYGFDLV